MTTIYAYIDSLNDSTYNFTNAELTEAAESAAREVGVALEWRPGLGVASFVLAADADDDGALLAFQHQFDREIASL